METASRTVAVAGARLGFALATLFVAACSSAGPTPSEATSASTSAAVAGAPASAVSSTASPPAARRASRDHEGGVVRAAPFEDALYIADQDHDVVRRVKLPVDAQDEPLAFALGGAPANVLPIDGFVLVTVRDPGALVVLRADGSALSEVARVALPSDAWGLAVTPDERRALVTSGWTHKLSAVDLATGAVTYSIDVGREPRGVVVAPDGKTAFVTHLVGRAITRVDGLDEATPRARTIDLPPAPLRAPYKGAPTQFALDASLAYAAALSPDGARLFVPRHAIGAYGVESWFGMPTVDVLLTGAEASLAPARENKGSAWPGKKFMFDRDNAISAEGQIPIQRERPFVQPRGVVYRRTTSTLLVAGEGDGRLAELDARALDPSLRAVRIYDLDAPRKFDDEGTPPPPGPVKCGAPSGVALSRDETYAYVFCRTTSDLAIVRLDGFAPGVEFEPSQPMVHIEAKGALGQQAALGRALFYDARDPVMSDGLACAGCHPDGRDDGHVWQALAKPNPEDKLGGLAGAPTFHGGSGNLYLLKGAPRQTPMLAGRVAAKGPYGWQAEAPLLAQRVILGFGLHQWIPMSRPGAMKGALERGEALAAFLREGLVAPPRENRRLTADEERGRALFMSEQTRCSTCHVPATDFTDRAVLPVLVPRPILGYLTEPEGEMFRTPSLLFVAGTPPYFHDGRAPTLEALVDDNQERMGKTRDLSPQDRAALVAYLKTIGLVEPGEPAPKPSLAAPHIAPVAAPSPIAPAAAPTERERSPKPTWPEWKAAAEVAQKRAGSCKLFRVREWFRAHCEVDPEWLAQIAEIAGSREGVEASEGRYGAGEDVVFPVRPGDRRVFEIDRAVDRTRYSTFWDAAAVVTAEWLTGDEPTVVLLAAEAVR